MTSAIFRTNSVVFSVSLNGTTVDFARFSVVTGTELTGDETTYNSEKVAQKRYDAVLSELAKSGAVKFVPSEEIALTPEQDAQVEAVIEYIYGSEDNVPEGPIPTNVTFGTGHLAVSVPVVKEKPESAQITGSKTVNGYRIALGNNKKGDQVAWVVE